MTHNSSHRQLHHVNRWATATAGWLVEV